jgi:hypothetical protein
MDQLKEMDEQIFIRDRLIKNAAHQLKNLRISSLFNNSQLVKDPYGICLGELSDTEKVHKKFTLSKKSNNSLPQLVTLKSQEEKKGELKQMNHL